MNKPKDTITTAHDEKGRKTVLEIIEKKVPERVYPVGRLDRMTTGLLLITNDGELAKTLSHPSSEVRKIYQVTLSKMVSVGDLEKIAKGVELEDGIAIVDGVSYIDGLEKNEIGVTLHSGKNRIVRRIFEHLGYEIIKLDRVAYAGLNKKDLPRGHFRYLSDKEVTLLKHFGNRNKKKTDKPAEKIPLERTKVRTGFRKKVIEKNEGEVKLNEPKPDKVKSKSINKGSPGRKTKPPK